MRSCQELGEVKETWRSGYVIPLRFAGWVFRDLKEREVTSIGDETLPQIHP